MLPKLFVGSAPLAVSVIKQQIRHAVQTKIAVVAIEFIWGLLYAAEDGIGAERVFMAGRLTKGVLLTWKKSEREFWCMVFQAKWGGWLRNISHKRQLGFAR